MLRLPFDNQKVKGNYAIFIFKAEVLLLDEATSALDNETERAVNEMLLGLMKECRGLTVLTIAHRESSLAYCHRVIRLNGKDNGSNL